MRPLAKKATWIFAVVALLALSVSGQAAPRRGAGIVAVPRGGFYSPFVYDPFWDPYWGAYAYPYGGYPYAPTADVRVQVVPKQTEVFVDGYYAGTAGQFDGVFQRLQTRPGGHSITLYLDGYRTVTQNIYARPDSTFTIQDTMDKLPEGEVSAPPPMPARELQPSGPPSDIPDRG